MNYNEFANSDSGQLVTTIERQMAFVPNPLPPKIDMQPIAVALGDAMQAIGELKGACRRLQNPYMLVNPLQRREALTSSAMEGTYTSADKLAILEAADGIATDESTREVLNYINALRGALLSLPKMPICHCLIKEAHFRLLQGLSDNRGVQKRPGEYKNTQNWIGALHIQEARYIPPPALETQKCMDDLESYINRESRNDLPFLIEAALVHYQFEAIHPFADGNGRLGR
ncbi:MAG: Fic family protein, partial [Anderseniella sp.]|nr:Fic family protein [Anderseniella sp.]